VPLDVTVEDKNTTEMIRLMSQLDEEDQNILFRLIDKMLTNKKFKEFFQKHVGGL